MRLANSDVIGMSLLKASSDNINTGNSSSNPIPDDHAIQTAQPCLDALQVYLEQKGKGRPKTFRIAAERSCNYVIGLCSNKPLSSYTRHDALMFRDWLVDRGLTGSSITRNFSYVKAVINFAVSEYALDVRNPFVGVYHDRTAGVLVRKPIPNDAIRKILTECHQDRRRHEVVNCPDIGHWIAAG